MKTGEVIRNLRKEKNLTQEQMADMLGVSAPAVNKWENGVSMPDVAILGPLARLLDTDINTLLDFRAELSKEEVSRFCTEISMKLIQKNYKEAYEQGEELLKNDPGSGYLSLQLGSIFNGAAVMAGETDNGEWKKKFAEKGQKLLDYASKSQDRAISDPAIYYNVINAMNQEKFQKAEDLLSQIPDTYIKKEDIYPGLYMRQKKYQESKKALENMMLSKAASLVSSMDLYIETCMGLGDRKRAEKIADLQYDLAELLKIPGVNPYTGKLTVALNGNEMPEKEKISEAYLEQTWELLENFIAYYLEPENSKCENSLLFQTMETKEKQEEGERQKMYGVLMERVLDSVENQEESAFLREDKNYEKRLHRLKELCRQE